MTVLTWLATPWPYLLAGGTALGWYLLDRHDRAVDRCYDDHPSNWSDR